MNVKQDMFEHPRKTWDPIAGEQAASLLTRGMTQEDVIRAAEKRRERHEAEAEAPRRIALKLMEAPEEWIIKGRDPRQRPGESWERYQERTLIAQRLTEMEAAYKQAERTHNTDMAHRHLDRIAYLQEALREALAPAPLWTIGRNY